MELFENLNPRQREVVENICGNMLVVAGAGTGKTHALTLRIINIIRQGISPKNILAITFTNKSADELRKRIYKHLHGEDDITSGTFHHICAKILRDHIEKVGYKKKYGIIDQSRQSSIVKQVMKELKVQGKEQKYLKLISEIKSNGLDLSKNYKEDVLLVFDEYQKELKYNNLLDFDDLILLTVQLFKENLEVLSHYREKWKYISVDEYQDTNAIQYEFIRLLNETNNNLCVIGDSDQSIYAFRGACVDFFNNFEEHFEGVKRFMLEQNYRSDNAIISDSNNLIKHNKNRIEKVMWTSNPEGEKPKISCFENEQHEAGFVANEIIRLNRLGIPYSKMAVLFRLNSLSKSFEIKFRKQKIPFVLVKGLEFLDREEIKDIFAYLRLLHNPQDSISLLRIINKPARGIGKKTLEKLQEYAKNEGMALIDVLAKIEQVPDISSKVAEKLTLFYEIYELLSYEQPQMKLSAFLEILLEKTKYSQVLEKNPSKQKNVEELRKIVRQYDSKKDSLRLLLEDTVLNSVDDSGDSQVKAVSLMTVHSAKGLEFDAVFVVGLENKIFPDHRAMEDEKKLEEERNLMYVAMTRAGKRLYLLYVKRRNLKGKVFYNEKSRFLEEI